MLIQPKPYIDKLRLRNHSFGEERRRNMSKLILEKGTPFPKPIEYSDIDQAMFKWVDEYISLEYDGKRVPTYKLYSTQRISEYIQEWDKQDDTGNPIINFKTITRENNPQKGDMQGNYFNIPGHKDFAMFYVPVLQENGTEAFDKYTMKQPFQVNFLYSVSIVSNKMELVNEMNELMHYQFNAINCYISPNGHPMSMTLEDVSDNSEYSIDDRKYYSQTYKIKVRGYIIRKEDYKDIESFFNEGLKSRYNYRIHSTLAPISEDTLKNYGLANQIVSYCGTGEEYNAVVVVKIPRKYFAEILNRDNKIDPSVPMFREYDDKSSNWTSVFTPKLIQGIYCRDINKSFTNPNFNPVFEPAGCQFSDEQIGYFNSYYLVDWLKFDKARKNCSFQDLYASDKAHKTWDAIVNHYSNLFGVKPTQMVQYTMSEEDKRLFSSRSR